MLSSNTKQVHVDALDKTEVDKPTFVPFRLKLMQDSISVSETAFNLDTRNSKDETKTLKNEVRQIFQLNKSTPLRISYMGEFESSVTSRPDKGNILTSPNSISELNLDSSMFHMIHVEEKWKVKLQIDLPGKVLEHIIFSDESILQIHQLVLDDTKWDKALLYYGKTLVNNKAKIGDVTAENVFKLFATHPLDKDRRDEYMAKI